MRRTEVVSLAFFAWLVIGTFYSHSLSTALMTLGTFVLFLPGIRLMLLSANSKENLDNLLFSGAVSGGVAGFLGVAQITLFHFGDRIYAPLKYFFNPFWHFLDVGIAKLAFRFFPKSVTGTFAREQFIAISNRASGPFTNPIFYAVFLCMMIPLCTYSIFYADTKKRRILALVCLVFTAGGIAASYSRGPYLALVVIFITLLFYGRKKAIKIAVAGISGVLLVFLFAGGVFRRLLTLFSTNDVSINTRSSIWKACFQMLRGHYLFGYGTGIGNIRTILHDTYGIRQPHAHNLFLETLLESGIPGLLLMLALFGVFAVQMIRLARLHGKARGIAVSLLASVLGFCACGMTDYLFYGLKPLCYLLLLLGLSEAALHLYTKETPKESLPEETPEPELTTV